jgi:hypothetical protein
MGGSEHRLKRVLLFADLKVGQYIWSEYGKTMGENGVDLVPS